jgi:hypothetical protein
MLNVEFINVPQAVSKLKRDIQKFTAKVAQTFYEEVRRVTPIDRGRARRGWKLQRAGEKYVVENKVPYINVLEEGHSKQAPKGMIEPAIKQTIQKMRRTK